MGEAADAGTEVRAEEVEVHPPTRVEVAAYRAVRGTTLGLSRVYLRLELTGREKLPTDRPFILAPVHRSNLDFLMAAFVAKRRMRYMGKASLWKIGWIGRFFTLLGAFPVNRGTVDRAAMRTCLDVLDQGEPVVMFPEGTRREGPKVEDVFDGPAYVALRAGVPVVPVGIGGSDAAMPIGSRVVYPRKVAILVGDPIEGPTVGEGSRVPRRHVRDMTSRLKDEVQRLYDEAQRRAS